MLYRNFIVEDDDDEADDDGDHFFVKWLKDTAQKMKFSIKDFFNTCNQIHRKLQIWSHLLKKPLMENFIFCTLTKL